MNDETEDNLQDSKSWLDKISQAFSTEPQNKEEVITFLRDAHNSHLLDGVSLSIIEGAIQIADMKVREVMVPRPQMVAVHETQSPEEFLPKIISSGHSRFPVVGDNSDEIIGILLAKDLLPLVLSTNLKKFRLKDILRPVNVIPESKRLSSLLNEFRTNRYHIAVVIDEYGGISGLITIEDVLEEIVGEIEDEHDIDQEDAYIREADDGSFIVNALTPIEEFNEHFDLAFNDDEFDTIGGIVMQHLGRLPNHNEEIEIAKLTFKILSADRRRIRSLQVTAVEA